MQRPPLFALPTQVGGKPGPEAGLRTLDLLQALVSDPATTGGLASAAGWGRRVIVAQDFVVGVASGSVGPSFTASIPAAGKNEVGLLLQIDVFLTMQKTVNLYILSDSGEQLYTEQPAISGRKTPSGFWVVFEDGPSVQVVNPSANFYVSGLVHLPVVYLQARLFESMRRALSDSMAALVERGT